LIRVFNWLGTNKYGLGLCSVVIFVFAALAVHMFWRTHETIYLGGAVFLVALVANSWVKVYRHRNDPTWPRKLALVPRDHE
jgi:RsiW-degrading membrane proteinase PrsW (M82 family)